MIIKQEDFKYPTKEEVEEIKNDTPRLPGFKFNHISALRLAIEHSLTNKDVLRIDNLFQWDTCLTNRFGKLNLTYQFILVHFKRGISQNYNDSSKYTVINSLLFEYYIEIFYYLYFSSLDILAHIINLYFKLEIEERGVDFKKVVKKNTPIQALLKTINAELIKLNDYRNAFTHRFTPTMTDHRADIITLGDGREALVGGASKQNDFEKMLNDSKQAMQHLSRLMIEVTDYVKSDAKNNTYLYK